MAPSDDPQADEPQDTADEHTVTVEEDIHCACVFNPPVTGREVHDENGVYPVLTED